LDNYSYRVDDLEIKKVFDYTEDSFLLMLDEWTGKSKANE